MSLCYLNLSYLPFVHLTVNRMKEHFDNVRSFDGQEVVDMHVFQLHKLEDLSPENLQKVTDLVGQKEAEDFIP